MVASALIFFAVSYPFTFVDSYYVVTEVRLSAVLNPCFGFVFGPSGALGCALGNFICDFLTVTPDIAVRGFIFQFGYGLIPWLLLQLFPISKEEKEYYRFAGIKSVLFFDLSIVWACLFIAVSVSIFFAFGPDRKELFRFLFSNNISANFIFDIPLILLLVRVKRKINKMPKIESVSIKETLLVFFMLVECATILLVCTISYFQLHDFMSDVPLWDNVFYSGVYTALFFAFVQAFFIDYLEKKIFVPIELLAGIWQKDRKLAVEMCNELYNNRSEIGALSRAFLSLVDEIQVKVMKVSTEKTHNNGVGDVTTEGDRAFMSFFGSLEESDAYELTVNLTQIPKSCTSLEIDTDGMTFMTGEILTRLSDFVEKRKGFRVSMKNVSESTKMILKITGYIDFIEII